MRRVLSSFLEKAALLLVRVDSNGGAGRGGEGRGPAAGRINGAVPLGGCGSDVKCNDLNQSGGERQN